MAYYNLNFTKEIPRRISHFLLIIVLMVFIAPDLSCQTTGSVQPFGNDIMAKRFYSSTVDNNNIVWFLTESGIVSFDGSTWSLHRLNSGISEKDINDLDYATSEKGPELWIASTKGAKVVPTSFDSNTEATTYNPENSKIMGENVIAIANGKKGLQWFGTDKGISASEGGNWLTNDYSTIYPEDIFAYFPLSTMASSNNGDTLYVGTLGGGVMRFYKNDVDAVSGASEFAQWGPIQIPSDSVFSVFIAPDGGQWMGTDKGVAKHVGHSALDGWTIYDSESGLANDKVQAINSDTKGNMYFGTTNGLSVFDGTKMKTYRVENGLVSNDILTIAVDKNNVVWLGTDNGVSCLKNGEITSYQ